MYNSNIKKELESKNLESNSYDYLYKYLKDNDLMDKLDDYTNRLLSGEAVQYIIGNVNFYGNDILVNKNVLIPRFETELLVEKTIKYIKNNFNEKIDILDIGTGSGAIAITLDKELNSSVDAVDISDEAIEVAKENNRLNGTNVNLFISDVFESVNKKYDVIISNPPYICKDEVIMDVVKNNEPHLALYADMNGLYFYDRILKECSSFLKEKYMIAFEIGENQSNDIKKMVKKYLNNVSISIEKDYSGRDRFVFIFGGVSDGMLL